MDDEKYILTTEELVAWKNEIQDVKKLEQEEREIAIKLNGSLPKIEDKKFGKKYRKLIVNISKFLVLYKYLNRINTKKYMTIL